MIYIVIKILRTFSNSYNSMQVRVEDIQGRIHEVNQPFSLDNSKPTLKLFSQWPLNVYFPDVVSKYILFLLLFLKLVILV